MILFGVVFLASVIAIAVYLTPGEERPSPRADKVPAASYGWAEDKQTARPASFSARLCAALARTAPSA
ncbi:MAG TPA: hypothetical protein VM689_16700 [Aliidongia sp.]|nr:hypothetical protein [Aliidongia sp.]